MSIYMYAPHVYIFLLWVDVCVWLQARMVSSIPKFKRSAMVCKYKFNTLYKQYREDKVANNILGNDCYDYEFYKSLDTWWHLNSNVMKHVLASANDSTTPTTLVDSPDITTIYIKNVVELWQLQAINP